MTRRGQGRARGHETDSGRDQRYAQPASRRDHLMKAEMRNQGDEHISEGSGGQHVGEVGPGKGGHVGGEEGEQQQDSDGHPGIENGEEQAGNIVQRDTSELLHAAGQQGIAEGAEEGDAGQDEVFAKGHWNLTSEY